MSNIFASLSDVDAPLLTKRVTVNPYRHGAFEIWNRLRWDLNPESWRSRKKLKAYKDRYIGKKAVIVCNGPSLLKNDLSLLEGVFTFGLNKINLLFDRSNFRPSCIVCMNSLVIDQNSDFFTQTRLPLFLNPYGMKIIKHRNNVIFIHESSQRKFAQDCSMSTNYGGTVTFVAIQLAFHMGFQHVALIGCDHNFAVKGPANLTVTSGDADNSHFDPRYFSGGVKWQLPDLPSSEFSYSMSKEAYEYSGRNLFNATDGGNLEIFPRIELKDFIAI